MPQALHGYQTGKHYNTQPLLQYTVLTHLCPIPCCPVCCLPSKLLLICCSSPCYLCTQSLLSFPTDFFFFGTQCTVYYQALWCIAMQVCCFEMLRCMHNEWHCNAIFPVTRTCCGTWAHKVHYCILGAAVIICKAW